VGTRDSAGLGHPLTAVVLRQVMAGDGGVGKSQIAAGVYGSTHRTQTTIHPKLTQQHRATKLLNCENALRRKHCSDDRDVKLQLQTQLALW
jgi:hypothetical protein